MNVHLYKHTHRFRYVIRDAREMIILMSLKFMSNIRLYVSSPLSSLVKELCCVCIRYYPQFYSFIRHQNHFTCLFRCAQTVLHFAWIQLLKESFICFYGLSISVGYSKMTNIFNLTTVYIQVYCSIYYRLTIWFYCYVVVPGYSISDAHKIMANLEWKADILLCFWCDVWHVIRCDDVRRC